MSWLGARVRKYVSYVIAYDANEISGFAMHSAGGNQTYKAGAISQSAPVNIFYPSIDMD